MVSVAVLGLIALALSATVRADFDESSLSEFCA